MKEGIAWENTPAGVDDPRCPAGVSAPDPVVHHLLSALRPALARPEEVSAAFVEHVASALSVHVAHVYGGTPNARRSLRGGLAPWQERRAKELMSTNLHGQVPLGRLAEACGLSVGHFARAFRRSAGVPPHRWLLNRRVERAKELLCDGSLSLPDIALACGFADQSHFTRVFGAAAGVSPGAWRRMLSE